MKDLFKDLFAYHHHFNRVFLDQFESMTSDSLPKAYPLFCHVINAHQIWNARITGGNTVGVHDQHDISTCRRMNEENLEVTMSILESRNPEEIIRYQNSKGDHFRNSVRDMLFHIINHSTHHKAQVVTLLRQYGLQPPVTDYIFFRRSL